MKMCYIIFKQIFLNLIYLSVFSFYQINSEFPAYNHNTISLGHAGRTERYHFGSIFPVERSTMKNLEFKRYEDLTFTDDFLFGRLMQNKELCKGVLECLLQHPIGELRTPENQKEFRYYADGKPIRLDIYTQDDTAIYDAEMQNLNHQSLEELDLPRRSRFYQSCIDTDFLGKGVSYRELPDSQMLFICTFDPLGQGLPIYSLCTKCLEDDTIDIKDGMKRYFFNCAYEGTDLPAELVDFYKFLQTGEGGKTALTKRLNREVRKARRNEEWRSSYMKERLHDYDMREEGRALGREEGIEIGRAEERENTERERQRAEALEAEVRALKKLIEKQ